MSTAQRFDMKKHNRSNIYRTIREHPGVSRQDIVQNLGLSLPTVTNNLAELMGEGLIRETGTIGHTGGRRAKAYSIEPHARTAIGFDITRNHITAILIDLNGEVMGRIRIRCPYEKTEAYSRKLFELAQELTQQAQVGWESVLGAGFGVPGLVTEDHQSVFYGTILNFEGTACRDFAGSFSCPAALFNDAKAAAFAEFSMHPELENAFYIMLSTNIGGAALLGGRPYSGSRLCAAEVGHIRLDDHGPLCYCGQRGCLDAYCSASVLESVCKGTLSEFFSELRKGNQQITAFWEEYLDHLAKAIVTVRLLYDCPIILGGYIGAYLEDWIEELRRRADALDSFPAEPSELFVCSCRKESIAVGAALYFINDYIGQI